MNSETSPVSALASRAVANTSNAEEPWDFAAASPAQYQALAMRQQHFNTLTWQVPPLSATAQSFLLAAAFNPNTSRLVAGLTGLLATTIALISIHLFFRHSRNRLVDMRLLERIEKAQGLPPLHARASERWVVVGVKPQRVRLRFIWTIGLALLGAGGLFAFVLAVFSPGLR